MINTVTFIDEFYLINCEEVIEINGDAIIYKNPTNKFDILIKNYILYSLLVPGSGQYSFDQIIKLMNNIICKRFNNNQTGSQ